MAIEPHSRARIEGALKRILAEELGIGAEVLAASDSSTPLLGRGIGLDSMETLSLVTGIEQEFAIQIADEHLTAELFSTLGSLTDYVERALTASAR
jgi:acyl carrier protein